VLDDRREVVDEALELAHHFVEAEHEHDRGLRGELDLRVKFERSAAASRSRSRLCRGRR
jgi:hypothetical protein